MRSLKDIKKEMHRLERDISTMLPNTQGYNKISKRLQELYKEYDKVKGKGE